ncbi:hypothetical protein OG533_25960 [Streptomyces sp. NBC_01186]|nr:hypothetical protein OG533_25960 [Streptomyces sp. NBC_01186]WSS43791.1 hypothetical protein OG220_26775 [Streptomyces sp. NBC_01187]
MVTKLLLSIHVLAAILAIGPIAVAASIFPRFGRQLAAQAAPEVRAGVGEVTGAAIGEATGGASGEDEGRAFGEDEGRTSGEATGGASRKGAVERAPQERSGTAVGAALLHRICRAYAVVGVVVPVFGIATGQQLGVLTDVWLVVSLVLTVLAAALLGLVILPGQERLLEAGADGGPEKARAAATRLGMVTGVFNLLWAVVVVLMIVRPGSTTGA